MLIAQKTRVRRVTRTMLCDECGEVMSGEMHVDTCHGVGGDSGVHIRFRCATHAPIEVLSYGGHVAGCIALDLPLGDMCDCGGEPC